MSEIIINAHSGLRWLLLLFLVLAVVKSLSGWLGNKEFKKSDNLIAILLVSFTHIQFLVGLVVYATSEIAKAGMSNMGEAMKNPGLRFWTVEHLVIMLLAVVLITIGRVKSKKATPELKHKKGAIFYTIALVLILWAGVIKPYAMGRGWI